MTKARILQIIAMVLFLISIYRGYIGYTSESLSEISLRENRPIFFALGVLAPFIMGIGALVSSRNIKNKGSKKTRI